MDALGHTPTELWSKLWSNSTQGPGLVPDGSEFWLYIAEIGGTLGGTRTPNLLVRSQTLYPLSYEGMCGPLRAEVYQSRIAAFDFSRR